MPGKRGRGQVISLRLMPRIRTSLRSGPIAFCPVSRRARRSRVERPARGEGAAETTKVGVVQQLAKEEVAQPGAVGLDLVLEPRRNLDRKGQNYKRGDAAVLDHRNNELVAEIDIGAGRGRKIVRNRSDGTGCSLLRRVRRGGGVGVVAGAGCFGCGPGTGPGRQ